LSGRGKGGVGTRRDGGKFLRNAGTRRESGKIPEKASARGVKRGKFSKKRWHVA